MKRKFAGELILVIYDITDDKLRYEVANFLKSKGLIRVQKSAFLGPVRGALRAELEAGLRRLVKGEKANIQIYPIPPSSYSRRVVIGAKISYDEESVEVF
ncbi:MAG: CRISPR-associated endonuclease Cas2 [Thermofilum sp. ex4484_79]|nr:MAG: CRISPR-associated endonuclease Cas2 [Thermofilum sp. ex4484_79]